MNQSKILRRCHDFVEAEAIRTRLDAAGILAVINGADGHVMLSYIGGALGGVKLEVAPEDYERAYKLLEDDDSKAATAGPWICHQCHEQNEATFEICWSCQKPRDQDDQRGRLEDKPNAPTGPPIADPSTPTAPILPDRNPYRPVLLTSGTTDHVIDDYVDQEIDDAVRRAFAAAIFGIILIPLLLNLYSVALLVFSEARLAHTTGKHRGRLLLTWVINLTAMVLWPVVFLRFWFA